MPELATLYENKYLRGFDRRDEDTMPDTSYDDATRTFTASVKTGSTSFKFLVEGEWYEKTSSETVVWPDVSGTYYFYFDNTGTLQYIINSSVNGEVFKTNAICGMVYWNATESTSMIKPEDELHGYTMPSEVHLYNHLAFGLSFYTGGALTGLVDASTTYTGIALSIYLDEDIASVVVASTVHPFIYREGADGDWVEDGTPNNAIAHMGTSYAYWNEWTGTTWQLTESTSTTDYIIYFFLRTCDRNNPIKKVVGQAAYASRSLARDALRSELQAIDLAGLPGTETEFMFAYIARRAGDVEDDGNGNAYVDLRNHKNYNLPE